MNHLINFLKFKSNEAIIDWESDNINKFYQECFEVINKFGSMSIDEFTEIGERNGVEIVNYDTFLSDLETDQMRKDAPPRGVPIFATVNNLTDKPRLIIQMNSIRSADLNKAYHMLKHENIHIEQSRRRNKISNGEYLGDVSNSRSYFSNKDEVMAFSQSISDQIMDKNPNSMSEAKKLLDRTIWSTIKRNVDDSTKKRYLKYIYLYLEREFDKKKTIKVL